jgi:hypothetical protein
MRAQEIKQKCIVFCPLAYYTTLVNVRIPLGVWTNFSQRDFRSSNPP